MVLNEELRHFLEVEIEITSERLKDKSNPCYDGVAVGVKEAQKLREHHIRFCEHLLAMIDK